MNKFIVEFFGNIFWRQICTVRNQTAQQNFNLESVGKSVVSITVEQCCVKECGLNEFRVLESVVRR